MVAASWIFLILSPVSFIGVAYITFKKLEGNLIFKLLLSISLGVIVAFIMFCFSAFIGMNFY